MLLLLLLKWQFQIKIFYKIWGLCDFIHTFHKLNFLCWFSPFSISVSVHYPSFFKTGNIPSVSLPLFLTFLSACDNCLGIHFSPRSTLTLHQNCCHSHSVCQFVSALSQLTLIFLCSRISTFLICPIPVISSPSFLCIQ